MKKFLILLVLLLTLFSCEEKNKINKDSPSVPTDTVSCVDDIPENDGDTSSPLAETEAVSETEKVTEEITEEITRIDPTEIASPMELFVVINEVCSSNKGSLLTADGNTPDWIELYNGSDKTVNLAGYGISNDPEKPLRYTFSNYLVEPGAYVTLMADGNVGYKNGVIYLPFKLSSDGETLLLTSPDGLTDTLTVPTLCEDESYGRASDGGTVAAYLLTPTPGGTNNTSSSIIKAPTPKFSHSSGFYGEDIELAIEIPEDCVVYYTTDGSLPTPGDEVYGDPIPLSDASVNANVHSAVGGVSPDGFVTKNNQDKANVIRAMAVDREGNFSDVVSGTYFVMSGDRALSYEGIPVLSVYTNEENLFDYYKGIYVLGATYDIYMNGEDYDEELPTWSRPANYTLSGDESEREAAIEYFDSEHKLGFSQNVGIRIGGNASRANKQKSFKFYARREYGRSSFDYPLFEGTDFVDTFTLRSGANDFAKAKIRDVLAQSLVSHRDITTASWQPCAMFLNGEYWGFYLMMERYDSDFYEEHYGVDKDEVVSIKVGKLDIGQEADKKLYRELRVFCRDNDLTVKENYDKLCSMIDMQSYIDYVCLNVIISNNDWPGNNTALWRTRNVDHSNPYADGKWRWSVYDTERSMSLYGKNSGEGYTSNLYPKLIEKGIIFGHVYKNPEFAARFCETLKDMLANDFEINRIYNYIDNFERDFTAQMMLNHYRYNTTKNYSAELDVIREFWQYRGEYILKYTDELLGSILPKENAENEALQSSEAALAETEINETN